MKDINEQIKLIDTKLLPLFGLKNVIDYNNYIKCDIDKKEEKNFIVKINELLHDIKNIFPVKRFNLHKTDNQIKSYKQSINILKMCLEIANINYVVNDFDDTKILRLNTTNFPLYRYIENMENISKNSDLRNSDLYIGLCDDPQIDAIDETYTFDPPEFVKLKKNIIETINANAFTSDEVKKKLSDITTYSNNTLYELNKISKLVKNHSKDPFTIQEDCKTPGTIEPHIKYDYCTEHVLHKQIKTKNVHNIIVCLGHFIKEHNGKKIIELPLKSFDINNIYSIKFAENDICDIKKNKIVDDYHILSNQFGYLIDGKFDFNKNLVPNNIIIPLNLAKHCETHLFIPLNSLENYEMLYNLYFNIEIIEIVFYKPFQEKLLNARNSFMTQKFDGKTLLYDFNAQDFIIQHDTIVFTINADTSQKFEYSDSELKECTMKIKNSIVTGYEIIKIDNEFDSKFDNKPDSLSIIFAKKCDFVKSAYCYHMKLSKFYGTIGTHLFTHKLSNENYRHILDLRFMKNHDTISGLTFNIPSEYENVFNMNNLKIIGKFNKTRFNSNNKDDVDEIIFTVREKTDKNKKESVIKFSIEELETKHINLQNNHGTSIRIIYESVNVLNILEHIVLYYDGYLYDTNILHVLKTLDNLFDPMEIEPMNMRLNFTSFSEIKKSIYGEHK